MLLERRRLLFALVMTAIIICGQSFPNAGFSVSSLNENTQSDKTDRADDEENIPHTILTATTYEAVVPILKLHINACFYLVRELVLLCEIEQKAEFSLPIYNNDFFIVLFRHILAPNAP